MSFYLMHRGWFDSDAFQSAKREPFCHRAAWIWLIEHAAFEATVAKHNGRTVDLQRGQILTSLQHLGAAWGWNAKKVARGLSVFRERAMIDIASDTRATIITICKYDEFQGYVKSTDKASDTPPGMSVGSDRDGILTKKESNKKKDSLRESRAGARDPEVHFPEWWTAYPHKIGKRAAREAYRSALTRDSPQALLAGIAGYIATKPPDRQWCNPATWLNQDRWLDEPANVETDLGRTNRHGQKLSAGATLIIAGRLAADRLDAADAEREARESGSGESPALTLLDGGRSDPTPGSATRRLA